MIASSKISEDSRKQLQVSLAESNRLLKKYYKQVATSKGRRGFATADGESINRPKFYKQILELSKTNANSDVEVHGVVIPRNEVTKILNLDNIKLDIITSVYGMIRDLAGKKVRNGRLRDRSLSFEDLESEALKSVVSSIHSYCDENICFSTYFYTCANRDINNLCNRSSSMSKISKKSISLKRKYLDVKKSLGHNATFDEVVSMMNIKQSDVDLLRKTLNCIIVSGDNNEAFSKYYSGIDGSRQYFASGSSRGSIILSSENKILEESLSDCSMNDLDFTPLERAVLDGVMQSTSKLGINSVAKNLVNPKTGKPFSRMAITYAWRRVKNKIKFKEAA